MFFEHYIYLINIWELYFDAFHDLIIKKIIITFIQLIFNQSNSN